MSALTQIANLLIDTLGTLFVYLLLLRFHMQWLRAPFRNPIGEFVTGLTNWLVLPARRIMPGLFGLDMATLIAAWIVEMLVMAALMALRGVQSASGAALALIAVLAVIELLRMSLYLLIGAAIVQALVSFMAPYSPVAPLLNALTAPFYRPFRRFIPPVGNIDLTPLFLVLVAEIALIVLGAAAREITAL
ncbi:MAG TPA: YggT family protein [Burkholderiales bacterium]|nr:YggT family protein [Burkholderiales bacterium]